MDQGAIDAVCARLTVCNRRTWGFRENRWVGRMPVTELAKKGRSRSRWVAQ